MYDYYEGVQHLQITTKAYFKFTQSWTNLKAGHVHVLNEKTKTLYESIHALWNQIRASAFWSSAKQRPIIQINPVITVLLLLHSVQSQWAAPRDWRTKRTCTAIPFGRLGPYKESAVYDNKEKAAQWLSCEHRYNHQPAEGSPPYHCQPLTLQLSFRGGASHC